MEPSNEENNLEIKKLCKYDAQDSDFFHELNYESSFNIPSPLLLQNFDPKLEASSSNIIRKYFFELPNNDKSVYIEPKKENIVMELVPTNKKLEPQLKCENLDYWDSTYMEVKIEDHSPPLDDIPNTLMSNISNANSSGELKIVANKNLPLGENKYLECVKCGKKFESHALLNMHMSLHNKKYFKCVKCGKKYKSQALMKRHMSVHSDERPFACIFCETKFKRNHDAMRHMLKHITDKSLNCTECGLEFKESHMLISHKMDNVACRKNFSNGDFVNMAGSGLKSSTKVGCQKSNAQSEKVQCTYCKVLCRNKYHLYRHQRKYHSGHQRYKCTECSFSTDYKKCLTRHKCIYVCNICKAKMSSSFLLKRHKLTHSKEKPHNCSDCGNSYKRAGDLIRHQIVHTDYYEFKCSKCSLDFKDMLQLKDHMAIHVRNECSE